MNPVSTEKGSVSEEVKRSLDALCAFAEGTCRRVSERLSIVCRDPEPQTESTGVVHRPYPALFEDIQCSINVIERSLNGINEVLDRCEL